MDTSKRTEAYDNLKAIHREAVAGVNADKNLPFEAKGRVLRELEAEHQEASAEEERRVMEPSIRTSRMRTAAQTP